MTGEDAERFGPWSSDLAEDALRRMTIARKRRELDRHQFWMSIYGRRGETDLARGAQLVASVAALGLATAPATSPRHHAGKVDRLRRFVDALDPDARPRMDTLVGAGLTQEVEVWRRVAGAADGGVSTAWSDARGRERASTRAIVDAPSPDLDRRDLARHAAAAATGADVDAILAASVDLVRSMIGVPWPVHAYSRLADLAYSLGATAMRNRADSESAVRTLHIIRATLRRWPRPTPVILAAIVLERERWGDEVAGSA